LPTGGSLFNFGARQFEVRKFQPIKEPKQRFESV
jgi:hypothetical protein